jgi:hypothetical protein
MTADRHTTPLWRVAVHRGPNQEDAIRLKSDRRRAFFPSLASHFLGCAFSYARFSRSGVICV